MKLIIRKYKWINLKKKKIFVFPLFVSVSDYLDKLIKSLAKKKKKNFYIQIHYKKIKQYNTILYQLYVR